ncbi:MAG TPA: PAS domain S-box protein, partial [Terriglobales bacterium]|nr:PAS domain S-box protein [Terriglobales bacterium]
MDDRVPPLPQSEMNQFELRDFLENAVVPLHWVDAEGKILWANRAEMNLLGYGPEEYIGHHIAEFHADEPTIRSILDRLARQEELHGHESRLRCKDGSIREVRIHSNVYAPDGRFAHTRCFTFDVTEQKRAQEAQARLAAIVNSSDDAIISKDLNGIITSWNAAATRIFGYQPEEIIGRSVLTLIPRHLHAEEPVILAKLARGERIDHYETQRCRKDGSTIEVSLTISPVRDHDGRVIGASKIARDITERNKTAEALRMADRLASVGRLAVTISHEINNPLEAVVNLIYLAKGATHRDPQGAADFLALAEQELARVSHITRQTLTFYRGSQQPGITRVAEHLHHLVSVFGPKLKNKSINLELDVRHDDEVNAVANDLQQVFTNLLSNSVDAVPLEGTIRIRVRRATLGGLPALRISVADSGPGITPDVLRKMFEAFYTTKKDVGTGLGLWVSRGIVKGMGGRIQVRTCTDPERSG